MWTEAAFFLKHPHLRCSRKVRAIAHPARIPCTLAFLCKVQCHFPYQEVHYSVAKETAVADDPLHYCNISRNRPVTIRAQDTLSIEDTVKGSAELQVRSYFRGIEIGCIHREVLAFGGRFVDVEDGFQLGRTIERGKRVPNLLGPTISAAEILKRWT